MRFPASSARQACVGVSRASFAQGSLCGSLRRCINKEFKTEISYAVIPRCEPKIWPMLGRTFVHTERILSNRFTTTRALWTMARFYANENFPLPVVERLR